jgi:hypothetical protein
MAESGWKWWLWFSLQRHLIILFNSLPHTNYTTQTSSNQERGRDQREEDPASQLGKKPDSIRLQIELEYW